MGSWSFTGHADVLKVTPNKVGGDKLLIHMKMKFAATPKIIGDITGCKEKDIRASFWDKDGQPIMWMIESVTLKGADFENMGAEIIERKFNNAKANKFTMIPVAGSEAMILCNLTVDADENDGFLDKIAHRQGDKVALSMYVKQAELPINK